jgi:hypothetical protein
VRLQIDFLGNVTVSHRGHRALSDDLIARGARLAVLDREQPGALARALDSGAAAVIDTIAHTADECRSVAQDRAQRRFVRCHFIVYRDAAGRTLDEARRRTFPDFAAEEALLERRPTSAFAAKTT